MKTRVNDNNNSDYQASFIPKKEGNTSGGYGATLELDQFMSGEQKDNSRMDKSTKKTGYTQLKDGNTGVISASNQYNLTKEKMNRLRELDVEEKMKERRYKTSVDYQVKKGEISKRQAQNELKKAYTTIAHELDKDELEKEFETNLEFGLISSQVSNFISVYGLNELTPPKHDPWWLRLFKAVFGGFFNILLWAGSILCFISYGVQSDDETNLYLGIVLGVVVTMSGVFEYFQESKSADLMGSLSKMKPPNVIVTRDSAKKEIDPKFLVPGDIIELTLGMAIPADIRVIECTNDMEVDNSSLTGESEPCKRDAKPSTEIPREAGNLCFFGTLIVNGKGKGVVISTGDNTFMGRTAQLASSTENDETPIAKEIKDFVFKVSVIAFTLGASFFTIGMLQEDADLVRNIVFLIGIIVANVPEGLLATVTVSLTLTATRMFHKNVRVKNLESVETLGSTSVICSDKTGTLTTNVMTAQHIYYDMEERQCETDDPYNALRGNFYNKQNKREKSFLRLIRCGALCNNAQFIGDKVDRSANATESAMVKFSFGHIRSQYGLDVQKYRDLHKKLHEIPFNSRNKWQVSVHELLPYMEVDNESELVDYKEDDNDDKKALIQMKGAPERVLNFCDKYIDNGKIKELTEEIRLKIMKGVISLGSRGERVLALAESVLDKEKYNINIIEPRDKEYKAERNEVRQDNTLSDSNDVIILYNNKKYQVTIRQRKNTIGDANRSWDNHLVEDLMSGFEKITGIPIAQQRLRISTENGRIFPEQCLGELNIKPGTILVCIVGPYKFDGTKKEEVNFLFMGNGYYNDGLVFLGLYAMINPPRPGVPEAVAKCQSAGIKVVIVTGDHPVTAKAIAEKVGIIGPNANTIGYDGKNVDIMSDEKYDAVVVAAVQERGGIVAVTGDSVNDSLALKKADIGVAMGITGTEVAEEAVDMILIDDNFATIVNGVE